MVEYLLPALLLVAGVVLFGQWRRRGPQRRIMRWRRALSLDRHQHVFDNLYADVDGFRLSRDARGDRDAPEFVYGEICFESFIALIGLCQPHKNTVFYDLGSGTGKAVLACAMVFDVQKSCGVELFLPLYERAQQQRNRLVLQADYQHLQQRIMFCQGDFLHTGLSNANLVFLNASAWFGEHWQRISQHLEQVSVDTIVITTSKTLRSDQFVVEHQSRVQMSWGVVPAYIHRRIAPATILKNVISAV